MKKKILTIHHLACTGGSVICKAIGSMLKTVVISEVNPNRIRFAFNPYDPIQLLLAQTNLKNNDQLRKKVFLQRVNECYEIAKLNKFNLVLRDHSHSDYMLVKDINSIVNRSSLWSLLSEHFSLVSILTIRNPIESYLSLKKLREGQIIKNFDDYCQRMLMMIDTYKGLGCEIIKYEDFCNNPKDTMKKICKIYEIEFNEKFEEIFNKIPMTGDSGRGKALNLNLIQPLVSKDVDNELKKQANSSNAYLKIIEDYNYKNL